MKISRSVLLLFPFMAASSATGSPRDCKPIRANRAKTIVIGTYEMLQSLAWAPGDTTLVWATRDGVYNLTMVKGAATDTLYVTARDRPTYAVATRGSQIIAPYIVYGKNDDVWTDTLNAPGSGGRRQWYFDGMFTSGDVRATTDAARRLLRYYRRSGLDSVYLHRHSNGVPEVLTLCDRYGSDSLTRRWSEAGILTMSRAAQRHDERTYYPDGILQTHRYDTSGPAGYCYKEYHPNGALKQVAFFQEGEPAGTWRYYGEDGRLLRSEKMKRAIDSLVYGLVEAAPPLPEIYTAVDQMPEARGDFRVMLAPGLEQVLCRSRKPLGGRYVVTFIVDEVGQMRMTAAKGQNVATVEPDLKTVFAALPVWKPGRFNGRPVRSKMAVSFSVK